MTSLCKSSTVSSSSSCFSSLAAVQQHILCGVQQVRMRLTSPEAIVYGVVGLLIAAEGTHFTLRWMYWRRRRLEKQRREQKKMESYKYDTLEEKEEKNENEKEEEEEKASAVEDYFSKLSGVVLTAPCIPTEIAESCMDLIIPLISMSTTNTTNTTTTTFGINETIPEVVRILWENRVRYTLDENEILTLLRRETQSYEIGKNNAISAASLALLWRLQLVRCVHEALIVHEDVNRCIDQISDLDEYSSRFYQAFIFPLNDRLVKEALLSSTSSSLPTVVAVAKATTTATIFMNCWHSLSVEMQQLRRRRNALQLRNLWSLAKYTYTSGKNRLITFTVMSALTAIAACNANAGLILRERVIRSPLSTSSSSTLNSGGSMPWWFVTMRNIISLLIFEWARQIITEGITRVMRDYIRTSASRHRDYVKRRLYEALAHTPLSYFDTSDNDTLGELPYYANDLEGVDVHVHVFLAGMIRTVMMLIAAGSVLHKRDRAVVLMTVVGCRVAVKVLTYVREEYIVKNSRVNNNDNDNNSNNNNMDAMDAEEEENENTAADGIMLHGMEIIEHIHELRPYGADTALMTWWMSYTAKYWNRPNGIKRVLHILLSTHRLWVIDGLISITKSLIPSIVAECVSEGFTTRLGALTEGIHATQEMLDQVLDTQRVIELVLINAYKANVLERILDSRHWEEKDEKDVNENEEDISANDNGSNNIDSNNNNEKHVITSKSTCSEYLLRVDADIEVYGIRAEGLQFQYPTAPTVNAFLSPLSFHIQLQKTGMGIGEIICITGVSGCGKTTLLRLLLALYTANSGSLMLQLRERHYREKSHIQEKEEEEENDNAHWFPLSSIPRKLLRCQLFSYVPQTATLFPNATIAQNISLQNRISITDTCLLNRVRAAAEAANCVDFIDRLPQGLLTPLADSTGWVAPGAVRLSGGQAQRLMLARALFHSGGVLLMDEPTAALDSASKRKIITIWRDLLQSGKVRGILCVTHDTEILEEADHILRL